MIQTEEIVKQAFDRSGVWPYSQTLQSNMRNLGKRLLQGIVSRYNNDDLLAFTEDDFTIDLKGGNIVHVMPDNDGWFNFETKKDVPDGFDWLSTRDAVYVWEDDSFYVNIRGLSGATGDWLNIGPSLDVEWTVGQNAYSKNDIRNADWLDEHMKEHYVKIGSCEKIRSVSSKPRGQRLDEWVRCKFVPWDGFANLTSSANAWTSREENDNAWLLRFKETFANQNRIVLISYNRGFELTETLRISDIYAELLIQGLTVKLCHQFPNDDNNTTRQETELANIIANVRTPKANAKMVKRSSYGYDGCMTGDQLLCGEGLWI